MKVRRTLFFLAFLVPLLLVAVFAGDYFYRVSRWKSKDGCEEITTIKIPASIRIIEYKVEAFFSLADRPNHWWLLQSNSGFEGIGTRTSNFTLGDAKYIRTFGDAWPELKGIYRDKEVGQVIMGIGTGNETLFISHDGNFAILNAFRT